MKTQWNLQCHLLKYLSESMCKSELVGIFLTLCTLEKIQNKIKRVHPTLYNCSTITHPGKQQFKFTKITMAFMPTMSGYKLPTTTVKENCVTAGFCL